VPKPRACHAHGDAARTCAQYFPGGPATFLGVQYQSPGPRQIRQLTRQISRKYWTVWRHDPHACQRLGRKRPFNQLVARSICARPTNPVSNLRSPSLGPGSDFPESATSLVLGAPHNSSESLSVTRARSLGFCSLRLPGNAIDSHTADESTRGPGQSKCVWNERYPSLRTARQLALDTRLSRRFPRCCQFGLISHASRATLRGRRNVAATENSPGTTVRTSRARLHRRMASERPARVAADSRS
jgi:hypothetical protein